jgi:peptidoglycan/xylan/chitin deacetylase (PgdA/CDA1 family)
MTSASCTVVFYHYVREVQGTPFPNIKALAPGDFAAQLDWLQRRTTIIDGETFTAWLDGRRAYEAPTALLTFDDGFLDHYATVFPMLRARGIAGIFFVSGATLGPHPELLNVHKTHLLLSVLGSDRFASAVLEEIDEEAAGAAAAVSRDGVYRYDQPPDVHAKRLLNYELPYAVADYVLDVLCRRHVGEPAELARQLYLSPDMIAEMAACGMTFGFHTERHRVLSRLGRAEQEAELRGGVALIRRLTGQRSVPFCYPYGFTHTYDSETLAILAAAGYSMAFNTVREPVRLPVASRFELPRFDTRDVRRLAEMPTHPIHA